MPALPGATAGIVAKKSHWVKDCWEPGGEQRRSSPKWFKSQDKAKQPRN